MGFLPTVAPAWFPPTGFDGTSVRAIWLETMSIVQGALGCSYLILRWVMPAMSRAVSFRPQTQTSTAGSLVSAGTTANVG